jgi:hypothetical protein
MLPVSPTTRIQARRKLQKDEGLEPEDLALAFKIFRGDPGLADEYLLFDDSTEHGIAARKAWLRSEIDVLKNI